MAHGLKACWSGTQLASNGVVLGTFAIYWRESRSPSEQDQKIIGQIETEDTLAFSVLENIRPMIETAPLEQAADTYARMMKGKQDFAWCWLQKNWSRLGCLE